ncbi:MAG: MFS transporter [Clostridiales bacterium]|nr:MFS transporter [Clostridiales bacterium]
MENWKRNLYILWFTQILSVMSFGFGLPFLPFYIQELGVVEPAKITLFTGILSTAPAITMAIMAPVWGILSDRYGRKLMIMRAMFAAVFVIGGMGFVSNVYQLVALRTAQGLFTGTITAATTFVASDSPKDKLSFSLGFMSSSTFIGFSLGPVLGGYFAESIGYRFSFYAGAALMLIGFILVTFLVREDKEKIKINNVNKVKGGYKKIFTPLILGLLIVLFLLRVTRSIFSPYLPLFIQEMLDTSIGAAKLTGYANGVVGFATALAGLTISRMGDRLNKLNLSIVLLLFSIVFAIGINFTKTLPQFIIVYGILFFFLGGLEPIIISTTAQNTPDALRGSLFGFQGLVGSLGWMVSPMTGAVISMQYGIKSILWVIPVVIAINMITLAIIKSKKIDS